MVEHYPCFFESDDFLAMAWQGQLGLQHLHQEVGPGGLKLSERSYAPRQAYYLGKMPPPLVPALEADGDKPAGTSNQWTMDWIIC